MKDEKQSHQSCKRTVLSSRYIVFERKSMPMVACQQDEKRNSGNAITATITCI